MKEKIKRHIPKSALFLYKCIKNPQDAFELIRFLLHPHQRLNFKQRYYIFSRMCLITAHVTCHHLHKEMLAFIRDLLALPSTVQGCIVEAGCSKGGSTAKFSIMANLLGRKLVVFDSFEGLPEHTETHDKNIFGGQALFSPGDYIGTIEEVKAVVARFGEIGSCDFIKGWFEETLPNFSEPIAAAYIDVDLASSTRTCLKYFYQLLSQGGVLYSHDGHLPLVINAITDNGFWEKEIGCKKPHIEGIGKKKLIRIVKTGSA